MIIKRHNVRGFTLIEMILAVGVTALVLVAVNAAFFSTLRLRNATQDLVDGAAPVDHATDMLRRDLACAMTPKTNGILSGDFKVGSVSSPGISLPVAIEMYTATGALSENEPWGDVQKVTYELRQPVNPTGPGRDLIRSVTRNILTTGTVDVEDQWMMGGIDTMTITCFDGTQWQPTWDTTDTTSSDTNLPLAVKVEIQLAGQNLGGARVEPIQLLVPIDSMSRTNS